MRGAGTRGVGAHHMVLVVAIGTSPITDDGYTDQVCFSTPFTHTFQTHILTPSVTEDHYPATPDFNNMTNAFCCIFLPYDLPPSQCSYFGINPNPGVHCPGYEVPTDLCSVHSF